MGAVEEVRLVRLALDPLLVSAGFQAGQHGGDSEGDAQVIFCAAHDEFSLRHPRLPQANQQQQRGTCVDLVVDVLADGTLGRLDLEGTSVTDTLLHAGLTADGEAVSLLNSRPMRDCLPIIEAALGRLLRVAD